MKKLYSFFLLLLSISISATSQTNVSGGIYTNTTWTLANSPYIVVDTVVVFPGVTLIIEPGVVVKFDLNKRIEIRQGSLIAAGTVTDSIIFTSNALTPTPGNWYGIWLNDAASDFFNYCRIEYARFGIRSDYVTVQVRNTNFFNNLEGLNCSSYNVFIDTCNFRFNTTAVSASFSPVINHCDISNNGTGIAAGGANWEIKNSTIRNNQTGLEDFRGYIYDCIINSNQTGINLMTFAKVENCTIDSNSVTGIRLSFHSDSVLNCEIKYNGVGVIATSTSTTPNVITECRIDNNNIGIRLQSSYASIYCNKICNNTTYDLEHIIPSNANVAYNYWCADSATTATNIRDGYDDINLGLVTFMPMDSVCALALGIPETNKSISFAIYPNPTSGTFTIQTLELLNSQVEIFNILGEKVYSTTLNTNYQTLNTELAPGIYFVRVRDGEKSFTQKLVIE
jgi:hypothetical protein